MTVRGTNVRSEVCDAGCFCLESLIIMRHVSCIIHHTSCVMYHVSCVMCVMCNLKFSFMCHLSCLICHLSCVICHVSYVMCHVSFRVIWNFVSFDILCHLIFCVIWHFVSFDILYHLTFHAIWNFVSFDISCDLIHLIHHCQSHQSIYVQFVVKDRCVFKKWAYSHSHPSEQTNCSETGQLNNLK